MFAFEFECNQKFYVFLFQTIYEKTARDLVSHKGQKFHNSPLNFKITAIEYAETHGNRVAEIKFGVDRNKIPRMESESSRKDMRGRKSEGCTLEAQKDLDKLIDKSVSFVLHV